MEYRIKFELDYSNMTKDQVRDYKISDVLSDVKLLDMEIDPNIPCWSRVNMPSVGDIVEIDSIDYVISNIKFRISKDCYTTIYLVKNSKLGKNKELEYFNQQMLKNHKAMNNIIKS